jgi:thioredoxin reductase
MSAEMNSTRTFDAVIVGAGPAGLSAALLLGRCRHSVLLLDDGQPRNNASRASHGFFTRDGASPESLRRIGFEQLAPYDVTIEHCRVSEVQRDDPGFVVRSGAHAWRGHKLLLATGMRERDPLIPGLTESLGRGVFCCPYCDGWEVRDRRLGGLAPGSDAAQYALGLRSWSDSVTLFTHAAVRLAPDERGLLERHGVTLVETPIERVLPAEDGLLLRAVELIDGRTLPLDALFVHAGQHQQSSLAEAIGCEFADETTVQTGDRQRTRVSGVYVAGDAAAHVESIVVAAADGYRAALALHTDLRRERLR